MMLCEYRNCKRNARFFMGWNNENGKHFGHVCATHDKELGRINLTALGMSLQEAVLFERYTKLTVFREEYPDFPEWLAREYPDVTPMIIIPEKPAISPNMATSPVTLLTLSPRAHNALRRYGITTIGELVNMGEYELSKIRMLGATSLHEIREQLKELGIRNG